MKRCGHAGAVLKSYEAPAASSNGWVHAFCPDCTVGWYGSVLPWQSHRGRTHQPPRWVTRLIATHGAAPEARP